jgi:cytidylate kinase
VSGIVVAIDGPAASGKSTTSKEVARRLGYSHLNSGLLYRAIAWTALRDGWIDDARWFDTELDQLQLAMLPVPPEFAVQVQGEVMGPVLSASEISRQASRVAALPRVRQRVLEVLRESGARGSTVCDGRDIGTIVFPEAELKIFLVAAPEERARRRVLELGGDPQGPMLEEEVGRLRDRDARDASRSIAPLVAAPDAIQLDTTAMRPEQVVDAIVELAIDRGASAVDDAGDPV